MINLHSANNILNEFRMCGRGTILKDEIFENGLKDYNFIFSISILVYFFINNKESFYCCFNKKEKFSMNNFSHFAAVIFIEKIF